MISKKENGEVLWDGVRPVWDDFPAIGKFCLCCLNAQSKDDRPITDDSRLLLRLLDAVEKSIPPRPESPPPPPIQPSAPQSLRKNKRKRWNQLANYRRELRIYKKARLEFENKWRRPLQELGKWERNVSVRLDILERRRKEIRDRTVNSRIVPNLNVPVKRVNWKLLGGKGKANARQEVNSWTNNLKVIHPGKQIDQTRIPFLLDAEPSEVYEGLGSFDGYLAFCFSRKNIAVLDCVWMGNAIYILPFEAWKKMAQQSKTKLRELANKRAGLQGKKVYRIEHRDNWQSKLRPFLD